MQLRTPIRDFIKGLTTSSTASSFTSLVPTTTEPTGDGVRAYGSEGMNTLLVVPYGAGTEDTTFSLRVTGWRRIATLWVPILMGEVACTLSATVGIASATVTNTDRFCDTITSVSGPSGTVIYSPTADEIGYVMLDAAGFQKIQFTFDMTGATNGNVLYAGL
jgi:hypothetical protein